MSAKIKDSHCKPAYEPPGPHAFVLTLFLLSSSCASVPETTRPVTPTPQAEQNQIEETNDEAAVVMDSAPAPMDPIEFLKSGPAQPPKVASLPPAPRYRKHIPRTDPLQPGKIAPSNTKSLPQRFPDDLDRESLLESLRRQIAIMEQQDPDQTVRLGSRTVTQGRLLETLIAFKRLLKRNLSEQELSQNIRENFEILPEGLGMNKRVVFTGYYTPVIPASRTWREDYPYPLYRKPNEIEARKDSYESAQTSNRDYGFHLVASTRPVELTREAIDGDEVLRNKNLEVAWLKDDLERYFLHIQGSGFLRFPDGQQIAVQYMGSNEYKYQSVGRKMIDEGVIPTSQGSMQGIKKYFREHPEDIPKYLFHNPRYIFFNRSNKQPLGSSGAELVGGRAIATDKSIYPAGGLVFMTARKPILDANNEIVRWEKFSRFVLDQDTGSAIRGRGRADLYFGIGEKAGAKAGHYMERGKMYYLLLK